MLAFNLFVWIKAFFSLFIGLRLEIDSFLLITRRSFVSRRSKIRENTATWVKIFYSKKKSLFYCLQASDFIKTSSKTNNKNIQIATASCFLATPEIKYMKLQIIGHFFNRILTYIFCTAHFTTHWAQFNKCNCSSVQNRIPFVAALAAIENSKKTISPRIHFGYSPSLQSCANIVNEM